MGIKIGSTDINKLYKGTTEISIATIGNVPVVEPDYLCFEAVESGLFCFRSSNEEMQLPSLKIRIVSPGISNSWMWHDCEINEGWFLFPDDKVYVKGNNSTFSTSESNYIQFTYSNFLGTVVKSIKASGNIMSLLDETCKSTTIPCDYCFFKLFAPATIEEEENVSCKLITPPKLPATTLTDWCYAYMFSGCTSLTSAPELPATSLASSCYQNMFSGCTSLQVSDTQTAEATHAWHIPETGTFTNETTYNQVYMFSDCLGNRSSDNMSGAFGESKTYYTQNEPI